jgi:hypothetical protein
MDFPFFFYTSVVANGLVSGDELSTACQNYLYDTKQGNGKLFLYAKSKKPSVLHKLLLNQ